MSTASIPTRGITGLFGRSGSGKTTLLRCIAGLERAAQARIECDGELWQDEGRFVPTYRRAVGYVFQESSLFAHLDVRGNLEFGLHRVPLRERRLEFDEVVSVARSVDVAAASRAAALGRRASARCASPAHCSPVRACC